MILQNVAKYHSQVALDCKTTLVQKISSLVQENQALAFSSIQQNLAIF